MKSQFFVELLQNLNSDCIRYVIYPGVNSAFSQASLKLVKYDGESIQLLLSQGCHHHLLLMYGHHVHLVHQSHPLTPTHCANIAAHWRFLYTPVEWPTLVNNCVHNLGKNL